MADSIKKLLSLDDDATCKLRRFHNATEADVKRDVAILKEWLKQEPHLPDDEDEDFLERMLLSNKCRVEVTKRRLEKLYTCRTIYPELMVYYRLDNGKFREASKYFTVVPLPKMTDRMERIVYYKAIPGPDVRIEHFYASALFAELMRKYDSSAQFIYLVDWTDMTFDFLKMYDLPFLKKVSNFMLESLNVKFSHTIYYKPPSYVDFVLKLFKLLLKPKLFERISIHPNIESVESVLPKELLPIEMGGQNGSIEKLYVAYCDVIDDNKRYFERLLDQKSNESLRVDSFTGNELFGTDGSFKKLNLD